MERYAPMSSSLPKQSRRTRWSLLAPLAAVLAVACGAQQNPPSGGPATKFVFAPRVGGEFTHQMKHLDEVTVPGSNFRDSQEWSAVWKVKVEDGGDKYLYRRRLAEFSVTLNGQKLLNGQEIEPKKAEIVQVMSKDGRVLDVTGAETLTEALASLVPESERARVKQEFAPERLRAMLAARAVDSFDEVVGKPAEVGSTWKAESKFGPLKGKTVVVDSAVGCGGRQCRKLTRVFDIDQEMVNDVVRQRVATFLQQKGWKPSAARVADSNMKVEDVFVVEPATCHFHDANLNEEGFVVLKDPAGASLKIVMTSKAESHADYPAP